MILIDRIEAKKLGYNFYFTGKPCQNGHIANRYVSSGNCCECHKQYYSRGPVVNNEKKDKIRETLNRLIPIKVRAFMQDVSTVQTFICDLTLMRHPYLDRKHVSPGLKPTSSAGGTALFKFNVDPDDYAIVMQYGVTLCNFRSAESFSRVRLPDIAALIKKEEEGTDWPPEHYK